VPHAVAAFKNIFGRHKPILLRSLRPQRQKISAQIKGLSDFIALARADLSFRLCRRQRPRCFPGRTSPEEWRAPDFPPFAPEVQAGFC
jgi:hypothetical protein